MGTIDLSDVNPYENQEVEVILQAGRIPLHSIVTKTTGKKEYKIVDSFRIIGNPQYKNINTSHGVRILVSTEGDTYIEIVPTDKKLLWKTTKADLILWLESRD